MNPLHECGGFVAHSLENCFISATFEGFLSTESLFKVMSQRLSWLQIYAYLDFTVFLVSLSHLYTHHLSPSLLMCSVELVLTSKQ